MHCRGLIVREISEIKSNFTATQTLEEYLIENKVSCLSELDTRALTRALRDVGAMKGTFCKMARGVDAGMERIKGFEYQGVDHPPR